MAKVKKDDKFCCADCGMEVVVNKACSCVDPELMCCGGPMIREMPSPDRTKKKATEKAPDKAAAKSKKAK